MEQIRFYRTPVDRAALKVLTKRRDLPGLMQSSGLLAFYLFTTFVSLYFYKTGNWVMMVVSCYFHSLFVNFLGMEAAVHELSHKTPFRTKWLNEFFYGLFSFLTWNNPVHFRESHKRHHQVTVFEGLDREVILTPGDPGRQDYISWFLFDWKKFRMIMRANLAFVLGKDQPDVFAWNPLFSRDDPRRERMFRWSRFQMLGHGLLIYIFIRYDLPVLIYTVSCSYFFATALSRSCEILQHKGLKPNIPDWRMTCHTMIVGPVISFFYWRMNYHVEHHMYAAVPFYNLPGLHKMIAFDSPVPVKGYWKGVKKVLYCLKRQRELNEWFYIPSLPETANDSRIK